MVGLKRYSHRRKLFQLSIVNLS